MSEFPPDWTIVPIREIITESRISPEVDDPSKRISVRLHCEGVEKRSERATDQAGATRYYKRLQGQFIYGKQNLHKGAVGIVPKELHGFCSSQDIPAFDINDSIDPNWLLHLFRQRNFYESLESIASGTGSKRIQPQQLGEKEIAVPPLPEQKKIAEILSAVDKSISINCQKITSLETLYTSLLADSLKKLPGDCLEIQLADACSEVFLGLTSKVDYVENEGVPLVRASNIKNGLIDFNATRSISQDQHLSLTKYRKAGKGDVLVTKSGSLGECAIVHAEKEFSIYESIVCLKPRSDLLSTEYLFHALQSRSVKDQFLSERVGSAVAHLNLNDFRQITLLLPSLDAQKVISKTLDALRSNKDHLKADTDKMIYLKSAISSDLLSGRKRVSI
jgi:restriction endonuclease S subunit